MNVRYLDYIITIETSRFLETTSFSVLKLILAMDLVLHMVRTGTYTIKRHSVSAVFQAPKPLNSMLFRLFTDRSIWGDMHHRSKMVFRGSYENFRKY